MKQLKNFNQTKGKTLIDIRGEHTNTLCLVFEDDTFLPFIARDNYPDDLSIIMAEHNLEPNTLYQCGIISHLECQAMLIKQIQQNKKRQEKLEYDTYLRLKAKYESTDTK